ncbi:MAG: efflux RND transporter periplasmic adaptor subunit [Clostridia bacterium]|nr:efflux RND transporter periplasmic adaptor subunit [Clostridia bacterium]
MMLFIRMRKNLKLKWVVIAAVIIVAGIAMMAAKAGGVTADVYKVSKGEIRQYVEDTAQVLPLDKQTVYTDGSGKITEIRVDVGDKVSKGDLLLSLEKTDLELQLKDAEARIAAAKAQLSGTELINYANKIDLAKAAVEEAKVSYYSAQRNFTQAKELYEADAVSKDEFEKANDAYKAASAALNSASAQLEDVRQGAPEHLKNGYKAQLEQAVIFRDTILRSIQKQEVRAVMDGVIIEKLVDANSPAAPSAAVFVIGNVNNYKLEADILADDANKVKIGNEVEISGKAVDNAVLLGKVIKIAPAAKAMTSNLGVNQKRVPVTIELPGKTDLLKPGYSLDIKIITAVKNGIIKVPDSSVFEYKGSSHVFAVDNGKAVLRAVKKGLESDKHIEILEGLKEGETILVKPDNNIKEGAVIKPMVKK